MLRLNQTVRLTPRDFARWYELTGFAPEGICTVAQLDTYIARCKAYYWGTSRETRYLHALIDFELGLQMGHGAMGPVPSLPKSSKDAAQ